jgi:murein L,D-transpeptidase YafK
LLSIDKKTNQAELKTWPENFADSRVLKSFKIAFGKAEGDKQREGDNKTPEGIYFPQKHIPGSKLLKTKYGPRAIPIDFPNSMDRLAGKTGYGIWLHGAGNDERIAKSNVTQGCVAFYNKDISKLSSWLEPYQALVVISKDSSLVNKPSDLNAVRARTEGWVDSWKQKSMDQYISFYSDQFKLQGRRKASYKKYKSRVFASYKNMKVDIFDLRVVTHPKYAVSIMNQDFNGDNRYISNGRKILFWNKNTNGQWVIVRELFQSRRLARPVFGVKEFKQLGLQLIDDDAEVGGIVQPKVAAKAPEVKS